MSANHSGAPELDGATEDDFLQPLVNAKLATMERQAMFKQRISARLREGACWFEVPNEMKTRGVC